MYRISVDEGPTVLYFQNEKDARDLMVNNHYNGCITTEDGEYIAEYIDGVEQTRMFVVALECGEPLGLCSSQARADTMIREVFEESTIHVKIDRDRIVYDIVDKCVITVYPVCVDHQYVG